MIVRPISRINALDMALAHSTLQIHASWFTPQVTTSTFNEQPKKISANRDVDLAPASSRPALAEENQLIDDHPAEEANRSGEHITSIPAAIWSSLSGATSAPSMQATNLNTDDLYGKNGSGSRQALS